MSAARDARLLRAARRICIVGHSGAGKSTLARQLGPLLGLPVTHLDAIFWRPGWVEIDRTVFAARVAEVVAQDRWIIDGGYGSTLPPRLARADLVIWLDYPTPLLAWRVFRRWRTLRGRTRLDMGAGCPERLTWEFTRWVLFAAGRNRRMLAAWLATDATHASVLRFGRPRELQAVIDVLSEAWRSVAAGN